MANLPDEMGLQLFPALPTTASADPSLA